jgi:hypothetical protein
LLLKAYYNINESGPKFFDEINAHFTGINHHF